MCECNLLCRLLAQKSQEGEKFAVCFWKSEKFGTSTASLEHLRKKEGTFIFKREIVGRILPVTEVSALLVEFNVLINVKSHCRILTDAWHFPVNVLWQETWRLPGQEFQNLALAHVLHHVLGFWICQSLTNDKGGEHFCNCSRPPDGNPSLPQDWYSSGCVCQLRSAQQQHYTLTWCAQVMKGRFIFVVLCNMVLNGIKDQKIKRTSSAVTPNRLCIAHLDTLYTAGDGQPRQ